MDRLRKLLFPRQLLDSFLIAVSVEVYSSTPPRHLLINLGYENSDFQIWFSAQVLYLCRVSFLATLDLYKAYFRGHHMREYKENICKRWLMPYSLWKKLLCLCALGFCNQVLFDLHCWWSEELCSQQSSSSWWLSRVLGFAQLVSHVLGFVHQRVAFIYWRVQRFWSGRRFLLWVHLRGF